MLEELATLEAEGNDDLLSEETKEELARVFADQPDMPALLPFPEREVDRTLVESGETELADATAADEEAEFSPAVQSRQLSFLDLRAERPAVARRRRPHRSTGNHIRPAAHPACPRSGHGRPPGIGAVSRRGDTERRHGVPTVDHQRPAGPQQRVLRTPTPRRWTAAGQLAGQGSIRSP